MGHGGAGGVRRHDEDVLPRYGVLCALQGFVRLGDPQHRGGAAQAAQTKLASVDLRRGRGMGRGVGVGNNSLLFIARVEGGRIAFSRGGAFGVPLSTRFECNVRADVYAIGWGVVHESSSKGDVRRASTRFLLLNSGHVGGLSIFTALPLVFSH